MAQKDRIYQILDLIRVKQKVSLKSILQSYHRNTHPLLFLHPAWGRTF